MHLFDQFSTEQYIPLSHDNTYLFDHFDRVHNFIRSRIDRKYRDILAKPQKRNFDVEWYSVYPDLNKEENSFAAQQYWQFKELLEKELEMLTSKTDADAKNWIDLLRKVFNAEDNVIYSNGENIAIIWGWKFDNTENQKPEILSETSSPQQSISDQPETLPIPTDVEDLKKNSEDIFQDEPIIEEELPEKSEFIFEDDPFEPLLDDEEEEQIVEEQEKKGFLEFLKEFAAKYWWLLIVLLAIIALVYFFKTAQL